MNTLICAKLIAWGLGCAINNSVQPIPQPFVYGKAVDLSSVEHARYFSPALPQVGPVLAFRPVPKPAAKPATTARQGPAKPQKAPSQAVEPVAAYAAAEGRGLGGIIDRFLKRKAEENPGVLYVKADGNEIMDCVHKNKFLMGTMQAMKKKWGKPVIVNSAYRSPTHNKRVRGAKNSYHMSCRALDVRIDGVGKETLQAWLRSRKGVGGVGIYCSGYVHFDDGRRRNWDWRYVKGKRVC